MTALCDRETPACASACSNWGAKAPQGQAADLEEIAPGDSVAKPRSCPTCDRQHRMSPSPEHISNHRHPGTAVKQLSYSD